MDSVMSFPDLPKGQIIQAVNTQEVVWAAVSGYHARKRAKMTKKMLCNEIISPGDKNLLLLWKISPQAKAVMSSLGNFVYDEDLDDGICVEERPMVRLENNSMYIGEWSVKEDMRHGRGTMIFNDGAIYEGYWLSGAASGRGRHIHADGDYYEG
jgi:hypothetical protein